MTPKEFLDKKALDAVREAYGCADFGRGKYEKPRPCNCYPDCKYGCGKHENYDLRDDCMADEFDNGFRAGWIAAMKHLYYDGVTLDKIVPEIGDFVGLDKEEGE